MARIVVCEFMDESAVAQLRSRHDVLYDPTLVDEPARLHAEAAHADAFIVRNRTQVRGALLAALARCRAIGRLGVGLDNIDVPACAARGAYQASAEVTGGRWPRQALSNGCEVGGKTLGLVGFGSIGRLTAKLAQGVGMNVIAHDAQLDAAQPAFGHVRCVSLDELGASADVISLHVPLLDSTRRLFDAARIAAMKPGAVLINTARGGVVDEAAVAAALRSGCLGGAALDVFDVEPLPAGSPLIDCPNLLLTPHIAGVTAESNQRVSALIAQRILEVLG
jgi:(S)-sulfolactate dehydrogenase